MSDEDQDKRPAESAGDLSAMDEARLATSRMRMVGEEAGAMSEDMTAEVFGHAGIADMVAQFTRDMGVVTSQLADRMDESLAEFTQAQQRQEREDGNSDAG